jgi:hypothetical protein
MQMADAGDFSNSPAGVNIVLIAQNEHLAIFNELIELLADCFEQLGLGVRRTTNGFLTGWINVVVGATAFLPKARYAEMFRGGERIIVFQMEALDAGAGFAGKYPDYFDFLGRVSQVWDYSTKNVAFLEARGCGNARHVPLGYSGRLKRIVQARTKETDVLFYGVLSPRRLRVLDQLRAAGIRVASSFGTYGAERDLEIGRAKIVLNLHQFETSQLEQVRISYLLNNRCFVITEAAENIPYGGGVVFADYGKIVECCLSYLKPDKEADRARIAEAGYAALKAIPMMENVRGALQQLGLRV